VTEHADEALAVVDEHRIAVEEVVADEDDLASGWCLDGSAGSDREVESGVGLRSSPLKKRRSPKGLESGPWTGLSNSRLLG
jgi:hypothetical protein